MINHSGQIGGSLREPVNITNSTVRFKPLNPVKEIKLMRSGTSVEFKQSGDWIELTVPQVSDFEMVVCWYK